MRRPVDAEPDFLMLRHDAQQCYPNRRPDGKRAAHRQFVDRSKVRPIIRPAQHPAAGNQPGALAIDIRGPDLDIPADQEDLVDLAGDEEHDGVQAYSNCLLRDYTEEAKERNIKVYIWNIDPISFFVISSSAMQRHPITIAPTGKVRRLSRRALVVLGASGVVLILLVMVVRLTQSSIETHRVQSAREYELAGMKQVTANVANLRRGMDRPTAGQTLNAGVRNNPESGWPLNTFRVSDPGIRLDVIKRQDGKFLVLEYVIDYQSPLNANGLPINESGWNLNRFGDSDVPWLPK